MSPLIKKHPAEAAPAGAIAQRRGGGYAVVPRLPSGVITADQLEALARTIRTYGIPIAKLTSGQRISLMNFSRKCH